MKNTKNSQMPRRAPLLLLLALLAAGCGGGASAPRSMAELINPALGPEYSSWMVGAASRLATPEEINEYLTLPGDPQAAAFIERFWQRRDPSADKPGNPIRETFEERSVIADHRYSESGLLGRHSDRGAVYVLYGLPKKIDHEVSPIPNGPPVEVWMYGTQAPSGLDGKRPSPFYRFVKSGDRTVLYSGRPGSGVFLPPPGELPQ
jgi:GWxTD domain-containing protein